MICGAHSLRRPTEQQREKRSQAAQRSPRSLAPFGSPCRQRRSIIDDIRQGSTRISARPRCCDSPVT
ncbi:hypothetical protein HYQ46_001746 [Verticillium longisporum]|nr:hypothetical protein HYQ46_001746 [Verticillium longisporum]